LEKAPDAFRTISEVADEIDVPQHVLRFWESRFPQIRPMKRGGGRRYYRPDDVDLLRGTFKFVDAPYGVALERGREFTTEDDQTAPTVAMVNQALVRRYWPNDNPIGKHIWLGPIIKPVEVVGVFSDEKNNGLGEDSAPEMFLPFPNLPWSHLRLSLRSASGNPFALVPAVRQRLAQIDSDQPITEVQTLEQILAQSRAQSKFTVALFGIFSVLALVLAIVGIYGVISYAVAQRTQELGIRVALGATQTDILKLVVGRGLMLAGVGIAIGLIAPFTLTPLITSLLYKVSPADPLTVAGSAILFLVAALLATYIPARRAMKVDPMVALKYE